MEKMLVIQKASITTDEEITLDTAVGKVLNALGALLIIAGVVIWFIILCRNEADWLDAKQAVILCTSAIILVAVGVWFELKSQRHQKRQAFQEYIQDDHDQLQDGEEDA